MEKFIKKVGYGYVKDNLKEIKYFQNCLTWANPGVNNFSGAGLHPTKPSEDEIAI